MASGYIRSNAGLNTLDISQLANVSATKCIGGIRVDATFSIAQFSTIQQILAVTFNGGIAFS